ncbi:MAG: sulfite exporter TauE/SafE family protein [Ignavibacteriales bacterium]|nr:sulfite exporter TauE/SafE family protein [Ignavibacteriales bacterium]
MDISSFLLTLLTAFFISVITLLTGFGVGSVLTPTFTLFYNVKTAVFLVSIVHLANNLLKLGLFARHIDRTVLMKFGFVSVAGALAGSLLQGYVQPLWVKIGLALFLLVTGVFEFIPRESSFRIPRRFDSLGGFFSGLMGGVIGNQGAIRSAYLLNYNLSKEAFIATATSIAILIDLTRIPIYIYQQSELWKEAVLPVGATILVAFGGTLVGKQLLKRVSLERFRKIVAVFLILFGIFLLLVHR